MEFTVNSMPIQPPSQKFYDWRKDETTQDWVVNDIKCMNCQNSITGLEYFCPWCGVMFEGTSNPEPPQETEGEQAEDEGE